VAERGSVQLAFFYWWGGGLSGRRVRESAGESNHGESTTNGERAGWKDKKALRRTKER